ncbi:MAG: DNA translocase FtsK [bacterium]|nr:DNA translocase FtsK [bacterium]
MGRRPKNKSLPRFTIDSATRREIIAVFFFALAALCFLAYFGLASSAGRLIDFGLEKAFGVLRPVFILLLLAFGFIFVSKTRGATIFGLTLLFLSLLSLTHLIKHPGQEGFAAAVVGLGGGYTGLYLAYPLFQLFGFWASLVILLAIFFIALSLLLPSPLGRLLASRHLIFRFLGELASFGARLRDAFSKDQYHEHQFGYHPEDSPSGLTIQSVKSSPSVSDAAGAEGLENENNHPEEKNFVPLPKKKPAHLPKIDLPLDLLDHNGSKPTSGDIRGRSAIIQKTLQNFGIEVEMGEVCIGPTVTQYTLRPAEGMKLASITALQNDLSLALAAYPLRIEAPIPGKSLVGIEVPNEKVAMVRLREVLESEDFARRSTNLLMALGKDVSGKPWLTDISRMPHLLVAGSTGSGKTVCLNAIILSLLYQNGPSDLKLILVDPKRVELPTYNDIPHLLMPVITDVKKTVQALRWAIGEMETRFGKLESKGARDIKSFNEKVAPEDRIPYLIIIVDELADLMAAAASEVEGSIIRLAQMSRAVGIHLILATQRPSVDVITGLIKANITSRIAFSVASLIDSRTILDTSGAEKLLGRGDMLFLTAELGKPKRLQGVFLSEEEIHRVVEYLKNHGGEPEYIEINPSSANGISGNGYNNFSDGEGDELLPEAKEVIVQAGKASASLLQRRLKVGYARAARILDLLEAQGFIGPSDGAKPREVLNSNATPEVVLQEPAVDDKIEESQ